MHLSCLMGVVHLCVWSTDLLCLTSSAPRELRKNKTHLGFSVFVHPRYSGLGHRTGALEDLCNSNKTIAVALQSVITQIISHKLSPGEQAGQRLARPLPAWAAWWHRGALCRQILVPYQTPDPRKAEPRTPFG